MSEKKHFGKFKNFLLRSGLPLEAYVVDKIQNYGLLDQGEYFYERNDKIFSIDINGVTYANFETYYRNNLIGLDFLIECKYREENRKWIFITFKEPKDYSFRASTFNIFLDFPLEKRLTKYGYHQRYKKNKYEECYGDLYSNYFPKDLPKVHKAVEIYEKGFNPKSIDEAIFQLRFGIGSAIVENTKNLIEEAEEEEIKYDKDEYFYVGGHLGIFIIPIIVTTAPLYVLNEGLKLVDIKQSKNLNEISKIEKAVFYKQQSHLDVENYIKNSFTFKDKMIKSKLFTEEEIDDTIENLSQEEPRILIINFDHFDEIFRKLLDELNAHFFELSKFWSKKTKRKKKK
jgi:hypothetical protein